MVGLGDGSSSAVSHVKGTREQTKQAAAVHEVEKDQDQHVRTKVESERLISAHYNGMEEENDA